MPGSHGDRAVSSVIGELLDLTSLGTEMGRRASARGVLLLWRAQARSVRRVLVRDGKTEETHSSTSSGHGVQVFTEEARTAFASRDDFRPEEALRLLDRAIGSAEGGARLDLHRIQIPPLAPVTARAVPAVVAAFEEVDLRSVARRLAQLEADLRGRIPGVRLKVAYAADLEAWRVFRSDGTDVLFAMPRTVLRMTATTSGDGGRHSVGASAFAPHPRMPWDEGVVARFLRRAERAARLALDLPNAPCHPAGSFPLVIDYALAKGLAHEAFGHASEADGYRSSVLARDGRFRAGEVVGAGHVSIVDEPIEGDHAWQPWSVNGVRRERMVIVDHGRLADGLSDPWSAGPGGVRLTDAARAESFHNAPLPRMSNIRIEVDHPLPAPGDFEAYGPEEVRDLLSSAGIFRRHDRMVFLSGYSGGQVNPATGDFVFNCKAIYDLSRDRITLHKPAIFSGSMFGALSSVREAFGPLRLDALGTCGKWGQSVPSSGGSHYFLALHPDPTVRLGGA